MLKHARHDTGPVGTSGTLTASPLPAIGLLGLLSLTAAMGLRMFDPRRSALS
jgi:hypothetical protein